MNDTINGALKRCGLLLGLSMATAGFPIFGWAQVAGQGPYTEVPKGTRLCSEVPLTQSSGVRGPGKVFWKVMSRPRVNGTQTVAAFVVETLYDRRSGDTTIRESRYDEAYASFFLRDPERQNMWQMISPEDGRVEATVGICPKIK
jgi:hypothetical protein